MNPRQFERERIALREKTLALMSTPMSTKPEKMRGHREWMVPLAERKYGA